MGRATGTTGSAVGAVLGITAHVRTDGTRAWKGAGKECGDDAWLLESKIEDPRSAIYLSGDLRLGVLIQEDQKRTRMVLSACRGMEKINPPFALPAHAQPLPQPSTYAMGRYTYLLRAVRLIRGVRVGALRHSSAAASLHLPRRLAPILTGTAGSAAIDAGRGRRVSIGARTATAVQKRLQRRRLFQIGGTTIVAGVRWVSEGETQKDAAQGRGGGGGGGVPICRVAVVI